MTTPALPPGFVLEEEAPPPGFQAEEAPPLPPGFVMEGEPVAPQPAVERPNAAEDFRTTLQFATPWKTYDTGVALPEWASLGLAGAGRSFVDSGEGIGQLIGRVPQDQVDDRRRRDADLMGTGAGLVGNVGGSIAQMFLPGAAISRGVRALGAGAKAAPWLTAAAEGVTFAGAQPVASGESRGENAAWGATGALAGQGVASAAGRLANGIVQSPAARQAMQRAKDLGVRMNLPQALDNPQLNTVSSALSRLPLSGSEKFAAGQRADFNRAVSATFGANSDQIDSSVYAAAKARIGGKFNELSERNELPLGPDLMERLSAVLQEARDFGDEATVRAVQSAINRAVDQSSNGILPGRAYQSLDSSLGKLMKNGGEKAMYLGQVRDSLRNAMDDSITPLDQAAWRTAREEYRNLKTIRDLAAKADGEGISPRALQGRVLATQAGKEAVASGRGGRLAELAKVGQKISDRVPNSFTADRALVYLPLLGGGGLASQSENPYVSGIGQLALATATGGVAARALNSPSVARALVKERPALQGVGRKIAPVASRLPVSRVGMGAGTAASGTTQPLVLDIEGGAVGSPAELRRQEAELERLRREQAQLQEELRALGIDY